MTHSTILGVGMSVPDRRLTNDDLVRTLDTSDEWIRRRTGIVERRIAAPTETTSHLATAACTAALADAELDASAVDVVIVATCTSDLPVPGAAPMVQAAIGARAAGAFDVNAGCTGFVQALALASALVSAGQARYVLACGAEVLSRITDYSDRTTAVLFGDGAGAVVVGPCAEPRLGPFTFGADGTRIDCLQVPAGGSRRPADATTVAAREHTVRMRGQDVYKHACDRMTEAARTLAAESPLDEIDLFVAHQANERIVNTVGERLGLRADQVVSNVARYGNTSAASIPIAIAELREEGRVRNGTRLLLVAFGAGFAWGAGLARWGTA